ncbi:hypothetical protein PCE1_001428 [Barthelona sp. PCE]
MPAKGKKGKKKKNEKKSDPNSEVEKLRMANSRIEALERMVSLKTDLANRAVLGQNTLRQNLSSYQQDFVKERQDRYDITSNMTRQFKSLQEELIEHLNRSQEEVLSLKDQLELERREKMEMLEEKDEIIKTKDDEIEVLKAKIAALHTEFSEMLKDTLDLMGSRLAEATNAFSVSTALENVDSLATLKELGYNEVLESNTHNDSLRVFNN